MKTNDTRPILCLTDFSENAARAAEAAAALAERLNAPLIVAHSVDERGEFPDHLRPRFMKENALRLAQEAARLSQLCCSVEGKMLAGIQCLGGQPDDGVVTYARKADARLVVVASSGTGALGRWMLGSVAGRTAESSPVPTLVVRAAEPFVAWARGERALKIFVATDFTETSDAALRWVGELRQIGPCEITLGYIDGPAPARAEAAVSDAMGKDISMPDVQQGLGRDLREKAGRLLGTEPAIRVTPRSARVDAHLIALATDAGADLLVLGTHQRHRLDRVWHAPISRRVLHDSPMSVACVPVPVAPQGSAARIPELKRVLVATDFSEHGGQAIPYAFSVLPREGAVCLLHVAKPGDAEPKDALEARLRALLPAEAATRGLETEVRVVESGDPAGAICVAAHHFGADLICVGSQGRSGLAAAVMGSVAQAVIARSARPVLVVRPPAA